MATVSLTPATAAPQPDGDDPERGCTIIGTTSADVLKGTDGDDVICGGGGADTIKAGAGDDVIYGDAGGDTIHGGTGNDVILGGDGGDTIRGEDGQDVIHGEAGGDTVYGGADNDLIYGGDGGDTLWGDAGDDTIFGEAGADTVRGGDGNDLIIDTGKADTLWGDAGDDRIVAGEGADSVKGGAGDDLLIGGPGDDSLYGDTGTDACAGGPGSNAYYSCERRVDAGDLGGVEGDLDGDGMPDVAEVRAGSDPLARDTDGDGIEDAAEFGVGTWPTDADSDSDGIGDLEEDADEDGLTSAQEIAAGTSGVNYDTDADGLSDGDEVTLGLDPLSADSDGDGLRDGDERRVGADPANPDTDGDRTGDGEDLFTITLSLDQPPVSLEATGPAVALLETRLTPSDDVRLRGVPGQLSGAFAVHAPEGVTGVLTVGFDASTVGLEVALLHFDEESSTLDVPPNQVVDWSAGTVTAEVGDFSPFVVVDVAEFTAIWDQEFGTGDVDDPTGQRTLEVILVLDSSGSMADNDPDRLRVEASKALIDALGENDEVGVVAFANTARWLALLSTNKAAAKASLAGVGQAGGTNLTAGMRLAITALRPHSLDEAFTIDRAIVLLTDGEGDYDRALTREAQEADVAVYTVGLGQATDEALLDEIATQTGGRFFLADSADDLIPVFKTNLDEIMGYVDIDGDGLSDAAEEAGMLSSSGQVFRTSPYSADTDHDGLSDGEEMGYQPSPGHAFGRGTAYRMTSDPTKADTDGDGLDDLFEVSEYLFPWDPDHDHDGVNGGEEADNGTTEMWDNTDLDGMKDRAEIDSFNSGDGRDPLVKEIDYDWAQFTSLVLRGALCGDTVGLWGFCSPEGWPYLVGQILGGFGFPVVRDLEDALANLVHGRFVDVTISLVGIWPIIGDTGKALRLTQKSLDNARALLRADPRSTEAINTIRLVGRYGLGGWVPKGLAIKMLDEVGEGAITRAFLKNGNVTRDWVLVQARRGYTPQTIERMVNGASEIRSAPNLGYHLESEWQTYVRRVVWPDAYPKEWRVPVPPQKYFLHNHKTDQISRHFDGKQYQLRSDGAAAELKKGKSKLEAGQTEEQIRIDGAIQRAMAAGEPGFTPAKLGFERIVRMYFPDQKRSGVSGPDWEELD
ncbi:MAG: VWA domain-containing protein, partial [Bifidobacteriaceae bacterium]|nr:VWA domain-containing protein [Bifidobacteriaceae bacterium]